MGLLAFGAALDSRAAQESGPGDDAIQNRIRVLEQEIQELKRAVNAQQNHANTNRTVGEADQPGPPLKSQQEIARERSAAELNVSAGEKGFSLQSADGAFVLRLRSLVQADGRFYINDDGGSASDTFLIRRARIELTGTLFEKFDFRIMPDFAPSPPTLLDAWLDWRLSPSFQVLVGKTKVPVGLERFQARENNLMNEFGYPTSLVPNRDVGIALHGKVVDGLDYYVGLFDGTTDGGSTSSDTDDDKSVAARLFATPFAGSDNAALKGFGFGIAGTYGNSGGTPSGYRTVGQETFFSWTTGTVDDGATWRVAPQLYYFRGPFGLLAEYVVSSQEVRNGTASETLENTAWQVTASWVLTGEEATFRGVKPKRPVGFGENRGWGAWQILARATELGVDDNAFPTFANPATSASRASSYSGGLSWYLNPMVRVTTDYNWTQLNGGPLRNEHVIITRVQFRF